MSLMPYNQYSSPDQGSQSGRITYQPSTQGPTNSSLDDEIRGEYDSICEQLKICAGRITEATVAKDSDALDVAEEEKLYLEHRLHVYEVMLDKGNSSASRYTEDAYAEEPRKDPEIYRDEDTNGGSRRRKRRRRGGDRGASSRTQGQEDDATPYEIEEAE